MRSSRLRRGLGVSLLAGGLLVGAGALVAPQAIADTGLGFTTPDGVTIDEENVENCNGILPNDASGNTEKALLPQSVLTRGGTAQYVIRFPADEGNVGNFAIADCVLLVRAGDDVKDYESVLSQVEFSFVNNSVEFALAFAFTIPEGVENGDQICNVAKTTESPSGSQAGNRKAGPACFVVGGQARVEKHDATNGALLDGATFSIHDCVNPAEDTVAQPIIVSLENAAGDPLEGAPTAGEDGLVSGSVVAAAIGFNGPSGATCQVTETAPPDGYLLPDPADATVTVTMGANSQTVTVFNDEPVPTTTTSTTTTLAPTTTTTTVAVLTTEQVTTTTTAPARVLGIQLARTGADTNERLLLAATVLILGGLVLLVGGRLREERVT